MKHISFFRRAKVLDDKFRTFLMNIISAGVVFNQATEIFLKKQASSEFMQKKEKIRLLERENDSLRREIESALYRQMILPGMRSDILALTEGCDRVINQYEKVILSWSVEKMKLPKDFYETIITLVQETQNCVDALVDAVKAFFDGQVSIDEEVQRCYFKEHVVDQLAFQLKEQIFQKKISLSNQLQMKGFVLALEKISDLAEDAADRLKVISVKHAL